MKQTHVEPSESQTWASGGTASLYLIGAVHMGIFAFATGQVNRDYAPLLGLWMAGCAVVLLLLAMVELRRGEMLFGTIGSVFGGLLGLGGALSFIRQFWIPGISAMDGWFLLSAAIIFFLLLPAVKKTSLLLFAGIMEEGIGLTILSLSMMGATRSPELLIKVAGWMALVFALFCWYEATAQIVNTVYKRRILPF
jgi:succinate-acetate transporter protein